MKALRTILGGIGIVGGILWFCVAVLIMTFRGFKAGGPEGGLSAGGWLGCFAAVISCSAYYIVVSGSKWSSRLKVTGWVLHSFYLFALVAILASTPAGIILAPLLAVGPVCWIIYAAKNSDADNSA
jgi:hypothetical protein